MANALVTGTVIVRLDGRSIRSKPGAKLNAGGRERTPQVADDAVIGFSQKVIPSEVTCTLVHTSVSDILSLNDVTDATLMFEADSGVVLMVRSAFLKQPIELTGGEGDVAVVFCGQPAVEA